MEWDLVKIRCLLVLSVLILALPIVSSQVHSDDEDLNSFHSQHDIAGMHQVLSSDGQEEWGDFTFGPELGDHLLNQQMPGEVFSDQDWKELQVTLGFDDTFLNPEMSQDVSNDVSAVLKRPANIGMDMNSDRNVFKRPKRSEDSSTPLASSENSDNVPFSPIFHKTIVVPGVPENVCRRKISSILSLWDAWHKGTAKSNNIPYKDLDKGGGVVSKPYWIRMKTISDEVDRANGVENMLSSVPGALDCFSVKSDFVACVGSKITNLRKDISRRTGSIGNIVVPGVTERVVKTRIASIKVLCDTWHKGNPKSGMIAYKDLDQGGGIISKRVWNRDKVIAEHVDKANGVENMFLSVPGAMECLAIQHHFFECVRDKILDQDLRPGYIGNTMVPGVTEDIMRKKIASIKFIYDAWYKGTPGSNMIAYKDLEEGGEIVDKQYWRRFKDIVAEVDRAGSIESMFLSVPGAINCFAKQTDFSQCVSECIAQHRIESPLEDLAVKH